jgi:hypothetical protein
VSDAGPGGGPADWAAALLDPAIACPRGLHTWNGSDPTARLAVYRNNVVSALVDALVQSCPVVEQLVGNEFFRAMAAVFVRAEPPRTRVLAFYGEGFPDFIAGFPPAASLPYLADVARLEVARVRAYHAADAEPVASDVVVLALASGERIGELQLVAHPSLQVVCSDFAVVSLWAAHQGDPAQTDLGAIDIEQGENALVLRDGLDVLVLRAPDGATAFAGAVLEGKNLGDAAEATIAACPGFDLSATLALLLGHGALTSIHLPRSVS